jgi:DNA-binding MarR family transcriptional regulator
MNTGRNGLAFGHMEFDGVDDVSAAAFSAFLGALAAHRRLMIRMMAGRGMHPGQSLCLRVLAANDGITQRDLAETLGLARPTISKMLRVMERTGIVARRADESDRRLTRVYLTEAGRARDVEMRKSASRYIDATIGAMPAADRREMARLLTTFSEHIHVVDRRLEAAGVRRTVA